MYHTFSMILPFYIDTSLAQFEIRVGKKEAGSTLNPLCGVHYGIVPRGGLAIVNCTSPLLGSVVSVRSMKTDTYLILCEFEVMALPGNCTGKTYLDMFYYDLCMFDYVIAHVCNALYQEFEPLRHILMKFGRVVDLSERLTHTRFQLIIIIIDEATALQRFLKFIKIFDFGTQNIL